MQKVFPCLQFDCVKLRGMTFTRDYLRIAVTSGNTHMVTLWATARVENDIWVQLICHHTHGYSQRLFLS